MFEMLEISYKTIYKLNSNILRLLWYLLNF